MARILVVDDSFVMRKNLKSILTGAGHTIADEASNGKQAIISYKEAKPDLVTMDITMPIMDGIAACKQIVDENPEAKVIMISALDQKRKVFEALDNGAKHYIFKPITKEKVLNIVDEVLIAEGIVQEKNSEEFIDNQKNKMPTEPFAIENDRGHFVININDNINIENFKALKMAIKGFLFIKPLNIIFSFNEIKKIDRDVLYELNGVIESINQAGGEFKAVANDQGFIDYAREHGSILFD